MISPEDESLRPYISSRFLDDIIAHDMSAYFVKVLESAGPLIERYPLSDTIAALDAIEGLHSSDYFPPRIHEISAQIEETAGRAALGKYNKAVFMELVRRFDARIGSVQLPDSVLKYYPERLNRIASGLRDIPDEDYVYPEIVFLKDQKLASFQSFPICSRTADSNASLPRSIYRNRGYRTNLRTLWFIHARLGGGGPLYGTHVDVRFLERFNADGFTEGFLCIADLLRVNRHVLGTAGTSWILDPQLDTLTPHLTLLRTLPMKNGAYLLRNGTSESDIEQALTKSKRRRALYEAGDYMPTSYSVIWPRKEILRWANRVSREDKR